MNLSSKTQNSLKILLHIAQEAQFGRLAQGKDIALKQQINEPYLEQIMISLKVAGLVRTVRGRNGGYTLACTAGSISLLDVIRVCEGDIDFSMPKFQEQRSRLTNQDNAIDVILTELTESFCKIASKYSIKSILARSSMMFPEYVI